MRKLLIVSVAAFLLILIATLLVIGCFGSFDFNPTSPTPTATLSPTPTPTPTPTDTRPTISVPDDYPTISTAIANAPSGYRILVKNGTYYERPLNITKPLTIVSQYQNGAHLVFHPQQKVYEVESQWNYIGYQFDVALQINADNVTLSGFLISVEMPKTLVHPDYIENKKGLILVKADGAQILNNNLLDGENVNFVIYGNANKVLGNSLGSISINGNTSTIENNQISEQASITGELNLLNKNNVAAILLGGNNNSITSNQIMGGNVGINLKPNYVYRQIKYNTIWNNTIIVKNDSNSVGIKIGDDGGSKSRGDYNFFGGNTISQDQGVAILVSHGCYNVFYGNIIRDSSLRNYCVGLYNAFSNLFFGNSLLSDSNHFVTDYQVSPSNNFDNGSMGNYWHNHSETYVYPGYNDAIDNFPLLESPGVLTDIPPLSGPWHSIHPALNNET